MLFYFVLLMYLYKFTSGLYEKCIFHYTCIGGGGGELTDNMAGSFICLYSSPQCECSCDPVYPHISGEKFGPLCDPLSSPWGTGRHSSRSGGELPHGLCGS